MITNINGSIHLSLSTTVEVEILEVKNGIVKLLAFDEEPVYLRAGDTLKLTPTVNASAPIPKEFTNH